jgi:predicted acyl esterase
MGGCLLNDNLQYGSTLFTWLGTAPDPLIVGDRWRKMWLARLAEVQPPALRWMQHALRDEYWRSGSVCEDYSLITVPVLAVGGWADGYTNAVLRLLENLSGPRKGLIGPWAHAYPHVATPGPAIDFIAELVRWWDHWLKRQDSGLMDEPMLTCWLQESEPPRPSYGIRKGRWVGVASWPPSGQERLTLHAELALGRLQPTEAAPRPALTVTSPPLTGTGSGEWCPYGWGPDMPLDQRRDDAASALFDTVPLDAPLALLGGAVVELALSSPQDEGIIVVRLEDVAPDGSVRRITYGLRNLALTENNNACLRRRRDEVVKIKVRLKDAAHELPPGHRLRIALSTAYWPLAVGVPQITAITLHNLRLDLPVFPGDATEAAPRVPPVVVANTDARAIVPPARGRLSITDHLDREETIVSVVRNLGTVELADVELTIHALGSEVYTMPWQAPEQATSEATRLARLVREGWDLRIETRSRLCFDGSDYRFEAKLDAYENDTAVFSRSWDERIPRPRAEILEGALTLTHTKVENPTRPTNPTQQGDVV